MSTVRSLLVPRLVLALGLIASVPGAQRTAPAESPLSLERFDSIETSDGRTARHTHFYRIDGITLERILGAGPHHAEAVRTAADALIGANPELFASTPGAGVLVFDSVRLDDTATVVRYHQEAKLRDGSRVPVMGSMVRFVFDSSGRLSTVANLVAARVDGLEPPRMPPERALAEIERSIRSIEIQELLDHSPGLPPGENDGALESVARRVPFVVQRAEFQQLAVHAFDGGEPRVVYEALAEGESPGLGRDRLRVLVDAGNGEIVSVGSASLRAQQSPPPFTARGMVEVYDPNPLENPTVYLRRVYRLDENYFSLYGEHAEVHSSAIGDAVSPSRQFFYAAEPYPESEHMFEAKAYDTVDRLNTYLDKTGFTSLLDTNAYVDACDTAHPFIGALYEMSTQRVFLSCIETYESALDPDVTIHEIGHAKQHQIGGSGPYGYPFSDGSGSFSNQGLAEALCDFDSTSFHSDREWAEWYAQNFGLSFDRTLNSDFTMNNWSTTNYHLNGIILGAALWDLRERVGSVIAERIATQSVYHATPTQDFQQYFDAAILPAATDLGYAALEPILRKVFSIRLIYGSAGSYSWTTDYLASARPYADDVDETQSHTIPGASALRVTFDAYTKTYTTSTLSVVDTIEILDAGHALIGTYKARELQNQTLTVPGDTVRVRLVSVPGNNRVSAGYNVLNVAAVDPMNQPPVAVLAASLPGGMEPLKVAFDCSGSSDPDGAIIAYTLDLGDGSPPIQMDPLYPHAVTLYHRDGIGPITARTTFLATLTVTDDDGDTASTAVPITVDPYRLFHVQRR